jgi:GntR family transcriptional regulator
MDKTYFKNTFHFSSDTSAPLYLQLASYIRIQIQAGVLKPGDKMIAENDLCEILNVSRTTIRQCMNQLTEEGHIVRYRGKGSFIADQKLKRPISYLYDFTENMLRLGASPTSEVLISEVTEPADDTILSTLQMPMGQTRAFHLLRLRCANGDPILLENTYIPYYLCPGIEQYNFSNTSLYHTLTERYGLNLYHANETIEAIIINKEHSDMLKCSPRVPGYNITRISHLDSGYVFEYTTSVTRADKCVFQLDLYKNSSSNKNPIDFHRQISL